MNRQNHIKNFVRNTLGCTCPDQVFEEIEDREVLSLFSPHTRSITIGGRLLVYIWRVREADIAGDKFSAMLAAGKKERDARGLNLLRLVLAVDESQSLQQAEVQAISLFAHGAAGDDRIYLHVVSASLLMDI